MQGALKHLWQTLFSGRNRGLDAPEHPSDPAACETPSPDPIGEQVQTPDTKEEPTLGKTQDTVVAQEPLSLGAQAQETQSCTPCQSRAAGKKNSYSVSFQGGLQKKLRKRLRRKARKLGVVAGGRQSEELNPSLGQ